MTNAACTACVAALEERAAEESAGRKPREPTAAPTARSHEVRIRPSRRSIAGKDATAAVSSSDEAKSRRA